MAVRKDARGSSRRPGALTDFLLTLQVHEFVHHLPMHLMLEAVTLATHNWLGEVPPPPS